jgi:thioredoxin reductase (NADPH)
VERGRTVDLMIAGQGAAGYAAALYAARYGLSVAVCGQDFGGETATGGVIENYPGWPQIDGFDLMLKFKEQAASNNVEILESDVTSIERGDDCFTSSLADGTLVRSSALLLALGRDRRTLGLAHEEEWTGRGVSYCSTCDAPLYRGKVVAVVGGGNAAVDGAILCAHYAVQVYLVYRGEELVRPDAVALEQLRQLANIQVMLQTEVVELIGRDEFGLEGIRVSRPLGGSDRLRVDGLFVEIGADPRTEIPTQLGVDLNGITNEVHVDRMMHTNVEGVFAAGDLTDGSGPLKQTITAAAQGAIAAFSAYHHVSTDRSG